MAKKNRIPSRLSLYLSSGKPSWFIYDPPYQMFNILWRFHKNDADDVVSIPHGDSVDTKRKYQLNPYDGKIYHGKTEIGTISKKEFARLWKDTNFIRYANEARVVYLSKHPNSTLPEIPTIKMRKRVTPKNQEKVNVMDANSNYQIVIEAALVKEHL